MNEDLLYMYVFVRSDLPPIDQVCQAIHAGIEAGSKFCAEGPHLVFCRTASISEVVKVCNKRGLVYILVHDSDLGAEGFEGPTALGLLLPASRKKYFRHFALWRLPGPLPAFGETLVDEAPGIGDS